MSTGTGQTNRSRAYLHGIFQGSLWIHDLFPDCRIRRFESVILFLVRVVDDVPGKH